LEIVAAGASDGFAGVVVVSSVFFCSLLPQEAKKKGKAKAYNTSIFFISFNLY